MSAALAGVAAWLTSGTIGFDAPGGARVALLSTAPLHVVLAVAAAALVLAVGWTRGRGVATAIAVSPLLLILLPWLPFQVPAAFLLWTGAFASLPWIAAACGLAVVLRPDAWGNEPAPRSHARAAAVLAFVVFAAAAWGVSPSLPAGDEPHYLVITQSLLYDHDLKIENNHRRGDYRAYFAGDLQPDFVRRGQNGEIYSIHAPGVPALVLPAFAIGGYHAVVIFLILIAACASGVAWWLGWKVTGSAGAAWFGWAAVCLTAPYLLETFTVYPDGVGAAAVLVGVWGLLRAAWPDDDRHWPWVLHGAALALLPWMHTRFAVLAATLGGMTLVRLARVKNPTGKAIAFLSVPAASALAWMFFFAIVYGTPDPSAPYGGRVENSFAYFDNGIGGLLFDQGFGLFAMAPVLALAVAGLARVRRLALDLAVVAVPYLVAIATFAMWWAGWSGPARFLVPLVLALAVPAACAWRAATTRGARAVLTTALVVSIWIAGVTAFGGGGRLAYHARNEAGATAAPWADWANHLVDVPAALPAFVPLPVGSAVSARHAAARAGFSVTVVWIVCLGAAAMLVFSIFRLKAEATGAEATGAEATGAEATHAEATIFRLKAEATGAEATCAASAFAFGVAAMVALSVAWRLTGTPAVTTARAQMDMLRAISDGRVHAVDLTGRHRVPLDQLAGRMRLVIDVPNTRGRGPRLQRPLATFPALPAGDYELRANATDGDGWLMAGIGNDQFALVTQPLTTFAAGVALHLPVDGRALVVRGDELARDRVTSLELRPVHVLADRDRISDGTARRAVRYGTTTVFFLDDRSFPEPNAFWVGGARTSSIVIAPDRPSASVALHVRNGAAANTLTIGGSGGQQSRQLAPGEEWTVDLSVDREKGAVLVTLASAAGFRPSDVDPRSRDTRFLGVSVRLEP